MAELKKTELKINRCLGRLLRRNLLGKIGDLLFPQQVPRRRLWQPLRLTSDFRHGKIAPACLWWRKGMCIPLLKGGQRRNRWLKEFFQFLKHRTVPWR